jgi:hypothetical protein
MPRNEPADNLPWRIDIHPGKLTPEEVERVLLVLDGVPMPNVRYAPGDQGTVTRFYVSDGTDNDHELERDCGD